MDQEIFDWLLLLVRWFHITVAVVWIGESIFFMWLDRTFLPEEGNTREGHVGILWMLHGGGFYKVEKMLLGPTKVPERLFWFKWESYWTWLSGVVLLALIFYTGNGTFLLDETINPNIDYFWGVSIGLISIFGSWFFYDFVWENSVAKRSPALGHILTISWFMGMSYFLCHTLSGRAAYIHIGAMLGTWMAGNVFMRIIPRQLNMVEASKKGEPVNKEWGINAKNRSTHNTYFTLPIIFIMLSNHFPATYGHEYNWFVLYTICIAGACIREFFVKRESKPKHSKTMLLLGIFALVFSIGFTKEGEDESIEEEVVIEKEIETSKEIESQPNEEEKVVLIKNKYSLSGTISFNGKIPKGKKLRLPRACEKQYKGQVYSNEVLVKNGKLQNVLVRITKGHENLPTVTIPTKAAILDQKGCLYSPRVVALRVGQKLDILNSDPIFHNVKSVTKKNKSFNIAMPKRNQVKTKVFTKPEIFLKTKCSVHPWMGAYVAIMEHPYFSVSNKTGAFSIKNIPEGNYTIEVWHEVFGTQTTEIEMNNNLSLDFTYKGN